VSSLLLALKNLSNSSQFLEYFLHLRMFKYQNKKVNFEGKSYELFWVTDFAQHIMNRKDHHSHRIDLKQVEDYAETAVFIKENKIW